MHTNTHKYLSVFALLLSFVSVPVPGVAGQGAGTPAAKREEAYKLNNVGVAFLEQFKYADAAQSFRKALAADPGLALARLNLALALHYATDGAAALVEAKAAAAAMPDAPQPHYLVGLISKGANQPDAAIAAFTKVLAIDPNDVGTNINLGQIYGQQRRYDEAIAALRKAVDAEPYNATALYNLANTLIRSGKREEGAPLMQQFQKLRDSGAATTFGTAYFEQGPYAEALVSTGREPGLVDRGTPTATFVDAAAMLAAGAPAVSSKPDAAGSITLFDADGDLDLDLLEVSPAGSRLLRNDAGKLSAWEALPAQANGAYAVAGDYDNDGDADLFVARQGGLSLLKNGGAAKFADATAAAKIPAYQFQSRAGAFVDADHDGDLDLFVAGTSDPAKPGTGAPSLLLRNNGDGTFADATADAKVGAVATSVAVVPTDFDNRRDVDLLVARQGAVPALFRNLRDGSFRDVAADVGLGAVGSFRCAAAGDVNKDGYTDFFFGTEGAEGLFALSTGKGTFTTRPGASAAEAAQFLDYDADGLLDLVTLSCGGLRVWRNLGSEWADVTTTAVAAEMREKSPSAGSCSIALASGDVDGDGDTDLVFNAGGGTKVARNDGGKNRAFRVALAAKVSNRGAVGAKVEMRAGSLWQKLETYSASPAPAPADVVFGLGARTMPDAVRVLWPAGIVQAETAIPAATTAASRAPLKVEEVDRKPSSCPFLYVWNGERFDFVTDFMGPGEMGYWVSPEIRSLPDTDEYVRVPGDRLVERDGRYELRVTNELEEVLYLDHVKLLSVAHPADTEIYPNEGMGLNAPEFKIFTTRGARPPVSAVDDRGADLLDRVTHLDRRFVDGFPLRPLRGYAERHALTLDLGESADRTLLLLTGWTDYAFSSDNVAAWQHGAHLEFPELQVRDARGEWTTVATIGIPVGRPQTVTVDLTGKFPTASREVRIVTNMRVYWDQILVDTSAGDAPIRIEPAPLLSADLRWRGFSRLTSPDGKEPFGYDYDTVTSDSPWKVPPGRYTREGDVRPLLRRVDDMYIVSRPGDEIALSFDASKLGRLPEGWKRTFLFYADGFSKEMDINSSSPDQVSPLPFHGMTKYPYEAPEAYPMTPERRRYLEKYNTRVVGRPVPTLVSGE